MRHLPLWIFVAGTILVVLPAGASERDDVLGKWLVEDKSGVIEIFKCKDKYCGRTVWIKPTADHPDPAKKLDVQNPDPKKRSQKLLGKTVLWGLTYDPEERNFTDGSIYNSRNGKVYSCRVTLKSANELHLRGFIGISLIGQTTVWTRR